jgi:hypothetical protein
MTSTHHILRNLVFKSPDFCDEFQYVDRNIEFELMGMDVGEIQIY